MQHFQKQRTKIAIFTKNKEHLAIFFACTQLAWHISCFSTPSSAVKLEKYGVAYRTIHVKNLDHFGAGKGNRFLKVSNSTFRTLRVTYKVICRSHHTNCHFMSFIFKGPVSFLSRSIFTSSFCHSSRIPCMNGSFITYFWDCWCMNMMPIFESNFSKVWYLQ